MKDFKQLRIWQKGVEIAVMSFRLTESFPKEEKFGLRIQITRAAVSIASNIAEGSSRNSEKDYSRFLQIALGSSFELETQLIIAKNMDFGQKEANDAILNLLSEEQKMISAFIRQLEKQRPQG